MSDPTLTQEVPPAAMLDFKALLRSLAHARADYANAKEGIDNARELFEKEHADEIAHVAELKTTLDTADAALRASAEQHFEATGEKKPVPGLEVKEWDVMVFDVTTARDWCLVHAPALLKLDESAYKKLLKDATNSTVLAAALNMPGEVVKAGKASVDKDLTDYM